MTPLSGSSGTGGRICSIGAPPSGRRLFRPFKANWPRACAAGRSMCGRRCPPPGTRPGSATAWIGPWPPPPSRPWTVSTLPCRGRQHQPAAQPHQNRQRQRHPGAPGGLRPPGKAAVCGADRDHRGSGRGHLPLVPGRRAHLGSRRPGQRGPAAPGDPGGRPGRSPGRAGPAPTWWPGITGCFGAASRPSTPGACW